MEAQLIDMDLLKAACTVVFAFHDDFCGQMKLQMPAELETPGYTCRSSSHSTYQAALAQIHDGLYIVKLSKADLTFK